MNRILRTTDDVALTIIRIGLGTVIFPHGAQKLFGWFGGSGPGATIGFFRETWGIPAVVTVLVIAAESLGSMALVAGFLSRVAALGIGIVMIGAVAIVHWRNGFFMSAGGYEFHILAVAMALAVVMRGSGALSLDRTLAERK